MFAKHFLFFSLEGIDLINLSYVSVPNRTHILILFRGNIFFHRVIYTDIDLFSLMLSGFGRRIPIDTGRSWSSNRWAVWEGALALICSPCALSNCLM